MSLKDRRIGFIGGGAMAEALAGGLIAAGVASTSIRVSDIAAERRNVLEANFSRGGDGDQVLLDVDLVSQGHRYVPLAKGPCL